MDWLQLTRSLDGKVQSKQARLAEEVMPRGCQAGRPKPPGPGDGYITAKAGEYVVQSSAVEKYGRKAMDAINASTVDRRFFTQRWRTAGWA